MDKVYMVTHVETLNKRMEKGREGRGSEILAE